MTNRVFFNIENCISTELFPDTSKHNILFLYFEYNSVFLKSTDPPLLSYWGISIKTIFKPNS